MRGSTRLEMATHCVIVFAVKSLQKASIKIAPLTAARWRELEELFGERGACGGCWCMYWRFPRSKWNRQKGAGNKRAFRALVRRGDEPGLIAYVNGKPAAWCALAPRESYPALTNSRVLKPVDEQRVWSVVCFFVARPYRRAGLTAHLLRAAVRHAKKHGARIVEGYPVDPRGGAMPDAFAWTGFPAPFRRAGFREVERRSKTRPIFRILTGR